MRTKLRSISCVLSIVMFLALAGCIGQTRDRDVLQYAPKEDKRLVIYTSHKEEIYWPIIKEFEERTGIWVEIIPGGTNELLDRLVQESDDPKADIMFGGGADSLEAYSSCFTPYFCREWELLNSEIRASDGLWTPFSALPVVLIYNAKLVVSDHLTCWKDLFSPAWQGRIAFCDPGISGSSFTGLVTMLYAAGEDFGQTMQAFSISLDGRQMESSSQALDSVADGTALVGITFEEAAMKRMAKGEDIALIYPSDGTSCVPDGGALVAGAPHTENAKLFLDFIVSLDVQQRMETEFFRRPVRKITEDSETLTKLENIPLVDYDIAWVSKNHDKILMSWAFYFGGGTDLCT